MCCHVQKITESLSCLDNRELLIKGAGLEREGGGIMEIAALLFFKKNTTKKKKKLNPWLASEIEKAES